MNCDKYDKYKNLIVIDIHGKLTPTQKAELENHLQVCPHCAAAYHKLSGYPRPAAHKEDIPMPDWEASWEVIVRESVPKQRGHMVLLPPVYKKWALAASVLLAVFVIGYFVGSGFFSPSQPADTPGAGYHLAHSEDSPLQRYVDHLEPVLVELANHRRGPQPPELLRLRRAVIRDMLEQTRILKQLTSHREDPGLRELLEDLELILVGISNTRPGDGRAVDYYINKIKEKGVRFKLRALASPAKTI